MRASGTRLVGALWLCGLGGGHDRGHWLEMGLELRVALLFLVCSFKNVSWGWFARIGLIVYPGKEAEVNGWRCQSA